jgi:hypothetical protein
MVKKILIWIVAGIVVLILYSMAGSWYGLGQMIGSLITGAISAGQGLIDGITGG